MSDCVGPELTLNQCRCMLGYKGRNATKALTLNVREFHTYYQKNVATVKEEKNNMDNKGWLVVQ